jgi:uncharacterized protein (TIGR02722 family)
MRNNRRLRITLVLAVLLVASGCASTKVSRVDTGSVTDLSGRWNDTDSRLVAETMVKEAISDPWLDSYTRAKGRAPVVIVGSIANRSHEHINVQTFVSDLERELTNSRRVTFVASKGAREEVREERRDQATHALESTQKPPGKEFGADYMMRGTISTIEDELDGTKAVFYQVDLEMVDLANNVKSWYGQKKIKKVIERKRVIF